MGRRTKRESVECGRIQIMLCWSARGGGFKGRGFTTSERKKGERIGAGWIWIGCYLRRRE